MGLSDYEVIIAQVIESERSEGLMVQGCLGGVGRRTGERLASSSLAERPEKGASEKCEPRPQGADHDKMRNIKIFTLKVGNPLRLKRDSIELSGRVRRGRKHPPLGVSGGHVRTYGP